MKVMLKKNVKKFQMGGAVENEATSEMEQSQDTESPETVQDPMMQLVQIFAQGLQEQNCDLLAQGAQAFLQLIQQAQGGAPAEEPVYYRKGGKLAVKRG